VGLKLLKELEEPRGGRAWLGGHSPPLGLQRAGGRSLPTFKSNYSIPVPIVKWLLVNGLLAVGWPFEGQGNWVSVRIGAGLLLGGT